MSNSVIEENEVKKPYQLMAQNTEKPVNIETKYRLTELFFL